MAGLSDLHRAFIALHALLFVTVAAGLPGFSQTRAAH